MGTWLTGQTVAEVRQSWGGGSKLLGEMETNHCELCSLQLAGRHWRETVLPLIIAPALSIWCLRLNNFTNQLTRITITLELDRRYWRRWSACSEPPAGKQQIIAAEQPEVRCMLKVSEKLLNYSVRGRVFHVCNKSKSIFVWLVNLVNSSPFPIVASS